MVNRAFILIFLLLTSLIFPQNDTMYQMKKTYDFLIVDSPAKLFTMKQLNSNYMSMYRLLSPEVDSLVQNKKYSAYIKLLVGGLFFIPLTHEEGHRSVLTALNIGAVSVPFFNSRGFATIVGVTDNTLKKLRDTDLSNFVRLHTSGTESDYMLAQRVETLCAFEEDDIGNIKWEYLLRKYSILQYYLTGLFGYNPKVEEEDNELERDIVGYDTYGAARHLYRPTMEFYRYTKYSDLTHEEKQFIKRVGIRSLLNILNPLIIGKNNFSINSNMKMNIGFGYIMVPFGDMIEQNVWILLSRLKMQLTVREFQNKNTWFLGGGIKILNYPFSQRLKISLASIIWNQPERLDFNTNNGKFGFASELNIAYKLFVAGKKDKSVFINFGLIHKTSGYIPENMFLDKHTGFSLGVDLEF